MKVASKTRSHVKVADEVWVATVLLHQEHPEQPDFSVEQIVERAAKQAIAWKPVTQMGRL